MPAYFKYAEEKLLAEVATMRYISENTTIPIPFALHHGMTEESPGGLGPFIIMEWVENAGDLVDITNKPGLTADDVPMLEPNVNEEKLERVYSQLADILLQLSRCELPAIGSLNFPNGDDENNPPECWHGRSRSTFPSSPTLHEFHIPVAAANPDVQELVRVLHGLGRYAPPTALLSA
jgi:aminoglycoside phosphotransferase (APT) family kinase protein